MAERGVKSLFGGSKNTGRSVKRILQPRHIYNGGAELLTSQRSRLVAIDVPPDVTLSAVRAVLDQGEQVGRWEYEEASLQHLDD